MANFLGSCLKTKTSCSALGSKKPQNLTELENGAAQEVITQTESKLELEHTDNVLGSSFNTKTNCSALVNKRLQDLTALENGIFVGLSNCRIKH